MKKPIDSGAQKSRAGFQWQGVKNFAKCYSETSNLKSLKNCPLDYKEPIMTLFQCSVWELY